MTVTSTITQTASKTVGLKLRGSVSASARSKPDAARPTFPDKQAEQKYLKERLAGAFRIFAMLGYDEGVAGHITVRDTIDPHSFWVNPYGVAFDLLQVSDLLRIDHDGNVLEGGRPGDGQIYNAAGYTIHSTIHHVRPDIHAAAHSHSPYGRAFSALGRNIDIACIESSSFADTVRLYDDFGGVVLDEQEGINICKALGPRGKGVILQNHGILSAASTVEAAVSYFMRLEKLCHVQLTADAAGVSAIDLSDDEVASVFNTYGDEQEAYWQAQPLYELLDARSGGDYKL